MTRNQRHSIGIFSRDGPDNYKWLINLLRMGMFQNIVKVAVSVYISNNFRNFESGLQECSFAILYHTKRRGRLNIANVTDSLYDQELEYLSRHLGRSNVVVLVDDLEDSSDQNMRRIVQEQQLDTYACEVILISEMEKASSNLTGADPRFSASPISPQMQDPYNSIFDKLQRIKAMVEDAPHNTGPFETSSESSYGSRSKGDDNSVVTSGFRSNGDDSVRSSYPPSSAPGAPLIPSPSRTVTIDTNADNETNPLNWSSYSNPGESPPTPKNDPKDQDQKRRKKDKMVFGIIGGLIGLLIIVLIIVLCVTL